MNHPGARTRSLLVGLALLLLGGPGAREASADDRPTDPGIVDNRTVPLFTYGSGFGFHILPDRTLVQGRAPFGGGGGGGAGGSDCPLRAEVRTPWPPGSELEPRVLVVHRLVSVPPGATNVRIMIAVDNDILGVRFGGVDVVPAIIPHEGCPIEDEHRVPVPAAVATPGLHAVEISVRDRGVESFLDASLLLEVPAPGTVTTLTGSAQGIGSGPGRAAMRMVGRFTTDPAVSFAGGAATATLTALVFDGLADVMSLPDAPIPLIPHPANSLEGPFTYNSAPGSRPIVRLVVSRTAPGKYNYRLEVSQGTVVAPPVGCPAASLQTSFRLDDGTTPIDVIATREWVCFGSRNQYLKTP